MPKSLTLALNLMLTTFVAHAVDPLVFISAFAPGKKGAIHAFTFNAGTGKLKPVARTSDAEHPFFMALSPDLRFLYSIHTESFGGKNNQVAAYALEGRTGKLKLLNRQSTRGRASCYLSVDSTGRTVLVANYSTGDVASLPVRPDGSLGKIVSYFKHAAPAVGEKKPQPRAHCFVISPDNRFALAADLGLDQVLSYRLTPATAKLLPNNPPFAKSPQGSGPRHLAFHPNGKLVYVINEISNTLSVFDYAAKTGTLKNRQTITTLPQGSKARTHTADVKITPDGKFLYGTNRGHDSIAAYRIGKAGKLTLIEIIPSFGKGPQNLAVTPDGRHLICANMPSNNVVLFQIDGKSGKLTVSGDPIEIPSPSCIMIVP